MLINNISYKYSWLQARFENWFHNVWTWMFLLLIPILIIADLCSKNRPLNLKTLVKLTSIGSKKLWFKLLYAASSLHSILCIQFPKLTWTQKLKKLSLEYLQGMYHRQPLNIHQRTVRLCLECHQRRVYKNNLHIIFVHFTFCVIVHNRHDKKTFYAGLDKR